MKMIEKFNFSKFSFQGCSLIEASAGTGKTYIITMLYLRLLLGIHNHHLPPLSIKDILLVTFTKTATEELRERIYNNICAFRSACIVGNSQNVFFSELLNKIDDIDLVCRKLLEAESNIGSAQIFTIHSFCQRILEMCPVDLRSIFKYNILRDEDSIFKKACNDFWRRYFYPLPIEIIEIIKRYWSNPKDLFEEIYQYLFNNIEINISPIIKENDIVKQHKNIINYISLVKNTWNKNKNELLDILNNLSLNRRIYSKKNLRNWIENIDFWANEKIIKDYEVPKELNRFKYSTIVNNISSLNFETLQYPLFKIIEQLFKEILSLKQLILSIAIREIRKIAKKVKYSSSDVSFNDLISLLYHALCHPSKGKTLARFICECYPAVIIDEFQDTDFYQYRIFQILYSLYQSKYGLLLIGDPKQSIYSFRGADIFSYLLARKSVDFHYTLNVNWRSSRGMVNAVNILFKFNSTAPFIFKNIPFIPMDVAKQNKKLHLVVEGEIYPSLHFWLPSYNKLTLDEYQKIIAYQCACTIFDLLNKAYHKRVWLKNGDNKKLLQQSDIVILVRDRNEGILISSILKKFNIKSVYLSNRESIFNTKEANDLLFILQAILTPENDNLLRCALMTDLIGYNSKNIDCINRNEENWRKEVKEFSNYYYFWKQYGLQSMLQQIILRRYIENRLLHTKEWECRLVNFLQLGGVLQKKLMELNDENLLVYWLNMRINTNDICSDDELLKLQPLDHQIIKIMTIHKSKGLEFPLVFLPFIPVYYTKKYPLFHDRESYQVYLDLNNLIKNFNLSEEERLSEDLRLFYVAITRAVYYCFLGVGSIVFKKSNINAANSDFHHTALGHLIQNGIPGNFSYLKKCLEKLIKSASGDIVCNFIVKNQNHQLVDSNKKIIGEDNYFLERNSLSARSWERSLNISYKITSYTELHKFCILSSVSSSNVKFKKIIDCENYQKVKENNRILYTPHTFPRGNTLGSFLHYIFQEWNFKDKIHDEWLSIKLDQNGIDLIWLPMLQKWLHGVANTPLDNENLMLSKLSFVKYISELQFYLPIENLVSAESFDRICKKYDPISRLSSNLKFPSIIGMLHGFIDLIFFWKGKYYLVDYKSNWLGETYDNYLYSSIKNEMIIRNYALQYQIYTIALHRFLGHKLVRYDYEKDFGGIYYLFLRGIDIRYPGYGIYFCRPKKILIEKLDQLFSFSRIFI